MDDSSVKGDDCCQQCDTDAVIKETNQDARLTLRDRIPIGVIGTGNAAIAITKRLLASGYSVIVGSRKPTIRHVTLAKLGHCLCGAELTSITECISRCEILLVAIHMENFQVTLAPYSMQTRGKIIVDMSNRDTRYVTRSNAEYLASLLPEAEVAKAFNTISAYVMENKLDVSIERQKVFVTSNNDKVRNKILDLSRSMGFQAVDFGRLKNSLQIEDFVLKVFTHWKIPIFLTFGIFNVWSLYIVYIYFIEKTAYKWEQIFLKVLNKPLCMTAITTLALTYLPGQIASTLQVLRGTKHSRFPRILDTWLKSRKQFGLITFGLVCFHVSASTLMLSPTYYSSWFHHPVVELPSLENSNNSTLSESRKTLRITSSWMVWKGELALLFGIAAFLAMCVQAVTSIQSVATNLNWAEWQCVQSKLGTCVLILAACHVFSMGIPGWLKGDLENTLRSITFLSLILPIFVLVLKLIFKCTPLNCYLRKIRKGWERGDGEVNEQNMKLESKIRLPKPKNYEPLSNKKRCKFSCSGTDDEIVKLNTDDNVDSVLEMSYAKGHGACCCSLGKDTVESIDPGQGRKTESKVRSSRSAKCDCSKV